jgi:hypothetical protein
MEIAASGVPVFSHAFASANVAEGPRRIPSVAQAFLKFNFDDGLILSQQDKRPRAPRLDIQTPQKEICSELAKLGRFAIHQT